MAKPLLDRLHDGVVLGDGGYLLALESRGYVQAGPFTPEVTTRDGKTPAEAAKMLEQAGADVVGTNCWQDPERMLPVIEQMRNAVKCYVAAQPVAYRCTKEVPFFTGQPGFPDRLDPYQLTRYDLGQFAERALELGVNYIGGCCGCVGVHIRQMARAIGRLPTEERHWEQDYEQPQSATEACKALREQGTAKLPKTP